ncbi:putative formin, FH2 domain-containing protein [Helianthus annuus]|nr:putative formin, FH2 domain-containing protein [Helianthus annuus]
MNVPRTESKLRVFSSRLQFNAQVSCLRKSLNIVNSAVEQASFKFSSWYIDLAGSAIGFRLDSLPKLADTLARNNRMTLMHYISKVLADKLPEVLDFSKDLSSLEPAAKVINLVRNFHKFYNIIESKMPFSSLRFGQFCDFRAKVCFFVSGSKRFKIMPFSSCSLSPSIFLC